VFKNVLLSPKNHDAYERMWKNYEGQERPQMTIWHMLIACWIIKATDTCPFYVILVLILVEDILLSIILK